MGVELEVDNGVNGTDLINTVHTEFRDKIYAKSDGSLTERGIEFVSHPATLAFHMTFMGWKTLIDYCKTHKYKSHDASSSCGLHIHVNRSFFKEAPVWNGAAQLANADGHSRPAHVIELKLAAFVHAHHSQMTTFARRDSQGYACYKHCSTAKDLKGLHHSPERHDAINFSNAHTIEFRMFKGTLNLETFLATLEFIHAACYFAQETSTLVLLSQHAAWQSFIKYISQSSKTYGHLIATLKRQRLFTQES